jgi:hypothetical protein
MQPRVPHRAPASAAALVLAALAAPPAAAQLSLVSADRAVSVDIVVTEDYFASCVPLITPGCTPDSTTAFSYPDSESSSGAGSFAATAIRAEFPGTTASQDSQLTVAGIAGSGSVGGSASFFNTGGFPITFHSENHDMESRLVVEFALAEATAYTLDGNVLAGGLIFSTGSARIRLSGPGGTIAEAQVDSDPNCVDLSCSEVGPVPLAASGTLAAGTYTLEAVAEGVASGAHSTSGSFGTGSGGSFEVELSLAVDAPSLTPAGTALLALLLPAAVALALRRRRRALPGYSAAT